MQLGRVGEGRIIRLQKQMGNGVGQKAHLHSERVRPDLVRAPLGYNHCRLSQMQTIRRSARVVVIQHAGDSPEVARAEHSLQLRRKLFVLMRTKDLHV